MKYPVKSYQKLFNTILKDEFPEIESFEVKRSSIFSFHELDVIVNLKSFEKYDYDYCIGLKRSLTGRMLDLTEYFGQKKLPDVFIYFKGKRVCDVSDRWKK